MEPDGTTVEHEFQAEKTWHLRQRIEILSAPTPGKAKRLGRKATLREDWDEVRIDVMRGLVLRKFLDHPELANKLIATDEGGFGPQLLIEGNNWGDRFWGMTEGDEGSQWRWVGENNLGIILMEVRFELTVIKMAKEKAS